MANTRQPSQPVERYLPTPRYSPPLGDTLGPTRAQKHRCRYQSSQGRYRSRSLSFSKDCPPPTGQGHPSSHRQPTPTSDNTGEATHATRLGPTSSHRGYRGTGNSEETANITRRLDEVYRTQTVRSTTPQSIPHKERVQGKAFAGYSHTDKCDAETVHAHGPLPRTHPGLGPDPHPYTPAYTSPTEKSTQPRLAP